MTTSQCSRCGKHLTISKEIENAKPLWILCEGCTVLSDELPPWAIRFWVNISRALLRQAEDCPELRAGAKLLTLKMKGE